MHRVRLGDDRVAPLLAGLLAEYEFRYGPGDEMLSTTQEDFDPPTGGFVIVVDATLTVAGGGFRFHADEVCEVKRMWTHPDYRRRGLAARVLGALERDAASAGYRRLVLETGPRQPEAQALYLGLGYRPIASFGPYPESRAFATELTRDGAAGP